ncbi:MAG: hypothetical protein HY289_04105 [Planctomycetes bacterium]|nr:hypothetical protein [Planctomycetota bacterium]
MEAVIPGHGPLFDRFNGGVSTGIGLGIPIGPVRESPLGGVVSWNAIIDYRYLWLDGRNGVQLNQPGGKDFNINHANFNLCEIGIERKVNFFVFSISDEPIFAGQPGGGIQCSMGVRGQFGGANADVSQSRFDPAKQQTIIQGAPRTQAFVGGYEVYAKLGYQLRNGIDISVYAGYGQLFTSLLQNQSRANGYVPLGVMVSIPLGAMEDTFVRRSIMQPR